MGRASRPLAFYKEPTLSDGLPDYPTETGEASFMFVERNDGEQNVETPSEFARVLEDRTHCPPASMSNCVFAPVKRKT